MPVAVTGSAGFIGRALVATLLDAGYPVIGIDRREQPPRPGLTPLTADLLDSDDLVSSALATADAVVHLAGSPGVRDDGPNVEWLRQRDNVLATEKVINAVPPSTPLVVTSSSSVYGGARGGRASVETDLEDPRGGYAWSKLRAERLCQRRLRAGGAVAIARPFTVAGEGQRPDMALAQWIIAAREGRPLRILGSLGRSRDITDVREVARVLAILAERDFRGTVNIGTGTAQPLGSMVRAIAEVLGVPVSVRVEPAPSDEPPATRADTRLLRRVAGFVPTTDLRAVVARQAAATAVPLPDSAPASS